MFLPFLRGGEMDILPFFEAVRWMLRGGEMDGRHAASTRKSSDGMSTIPHPQQQPWDEHYSYARQVSNMLYCRYRKNQHRNVDKEMDTHITARANVHTITGAHSEDIRLACMFASFVFLQFTVLGLANHAGEGYLTTGQRELVYYALQVFVIMGFLLHAFISHRLGGIRKAITYAVFGVLFACVVVMTFTGTGSLFYVVISMIAVLCLGEIGGAVHGRMSFETLTGANVAKCMGVGSAVAVVAQYFLQICWGTSPLLPVFMLGSLLFIAYYLPVKDLAPATVGIKKTEITTTRRILLTIFITVVFVLFTCFYNEYIHHLQIQSGYMVYTVYSWPRLMMVPVYALFALIGDRKKGKYVPVTSLCIMLIALMTVVLVQSPGSYWLNMCLFYFSIAAFTSYYLLTFWRLAPGTGHPALWAPFGRIIDSGMVLIAGAINLSLLPAPVVLGVDIVGVIVVILLMFIGRDSILIEPYERQCAGNNTSTQLNLKDLPEQIELNDTEEAAIVPETTSLLSPEEAIKRMQERYNLTPRETEVLGNHVLTEDTQAIISERLGIQVGTLQAYITRIYRKTGVKSRAGLTDLYYRIRHGD